MPDEELLSHAAAGDLHQPERARRRRPGGCSATTAGPRPGDRVRRQLARLPPVRGAQQRRPRAVPRPSTTSCGGRCSRSRSASSSTSSRDDRPVLDFLDGKHTFVNPALARHYGMPGPDGGPDDWVRVDDARRYGRGGLLPMAVFLTKNSPGLRTSPVKRGYWVVRRLLGENIPAPPPTVPDLPDDEAQARRADASADPGPASRRQELRRLPRAVRLDRPGLRGLRAGRRAPRRATSAAGPSTRGRRSPAAARGPGSRACGSYLADERRRRVRRQPLPEAAGLRPRAHASSPRTTRLVDGHASAAGGRR